MKWAASLVATFSIDVCYFIHFSYLFDILLFLDTVVLPYKDNLLLLSRYLQLVMESPGGELEAGVTCGDYLLGMLQVKLSFER